MSLGTTRNARVRAELETLARIGVLTPRQLRQLGERYPSGAWNVAVLARISTVLGVLLVATGIVVMVREHLDWWLVSELSLGLCGIGLLVGGWFLKRRGGLPVPAEAAELGGAISLQALVWVLAVHHSTGSGDWPAVVGANTILAACIAYATANRLVLWLGCVYVFVWLGARSGYESGWGAYWLGMDWPLRYLALAVPSLGLAWWHSIVGRGRWTPFGRVYLHFGLLTANLSLWFLSLFGSYANGNIQWGGMESERLAFSVLWGVVSLGCILAAARTGLRLLRGWGLTFLVINLYTFYFQFLVVNSPGQWVLHLLVVGGSLLALGLNLERLRGPRDGDVSS